jgi:hypothetical protein
VLSPQKPILKKTKAPSGRELAPEATEGACGTPGSTFYHTTFLHKYILPLKNRFSLGIHKDLSSEKKGPYELYAHSSNNFVRFSR